MLGIRFCSYLMEEAINLHIDVYEKGWFNNEQYR